MSGFPPPADGVVYLTEGGQETEVMYRHGHDLPEFALFHLLDRPDGAAALRAMYDDYLTTAKASGCTALVGGLDYRLSPAWIARLGISPEAIPEIEHRCIQFLRDAVAEHADPPESVLFSGLVGPWGDAYEAAGTLSADEAQEYHAVQIEALADEGVDLVQAITFSHVPEAIGVSRAAAAVGLPTAVSFTLGSDHRLLTGPTLREAIEAVDAATGDARPDFYGINCSHPDEFAPALEPGSWSVRLRMLRPNAVRMEKVELCQIGHLEDGDPVELGRLVGAAAAALPSVDIVGGCCGTWSPHLREIAASAVAARPTSVVGGNGAVS